MMSSTKKQLLIGTSALALVAAVSVASSPAYAAFTLSPVTGTSNAQDSAGANSDTLSITNGGNITYNAGDSVVAAGKTGLTVNISESSGNYGLGINNSGNNAAITASAGAGTYSTIAITGGTVSSANTSTTGGTILLNSTAAQTTTISNGANSTITNTSATTGNTIYFDNGGAPGALTITNAGTISAANTGVDVINVGATKAHTVNLTNTGTISAATTGDVAINITNAGGAAVLSQTGTTALIKGSVYLGNNAGSSFTIGDGTTGGGVVNGAVTLDNAAQQLNLEGGQVNGVISGAAANKGIVNVMNGSTAGVIGTTYTTNGILSNLSQVVVSDGITLNTATNNNTITVANASGVVLGTGANGATLTLGTGMVAGTIEGSAGHSGTGTLNFNGSGTSTTAGNIGDVTSLATINIASGATVNANTSNNTIAATNVNIGSGSTLVTGSGLAATVNGTSAGVGTLTFGSNATALTTSGNIGATYGLAAININDGASVTLANNATATTTTVGGGASGVLTLNAGKTLTSAVTLDSGSTLNQVTTGVITGAVNGDANGHGTYNITTGGTFTSNNAIGATHSLAAFTTANGVTANIANNINATALTFGSGASGTENQSAGTITGASTLNVGNTFNQTGGSIAGNVTMDTTSTLTLNGGSGVTGTINGDAAGHGTVNVDSAITQGGVIGGGFSVNTLAINNGGTLTQTGNIAASTVSVAAGGTLVLNNSAASTLTATNLSDTGTGVINVGTQGHTGVGTITFNNTTDVYKVSINDSVANNDSGSLTATTVTYTAAPTVYVDTSKATGYIKNGTTYNILVGTNAEAAPNAIQTNDQFVTFAYDAAGAGDLTVKANRTATYGSVATTGNTQSVGNALNNIGLAGTTNTQINDFLGLLEGTSNPTQLNTALKQATPQVNQNSIAAISSITQSMDVVTGRLNQLRADIDSSSTGMAAGGHVANSGIWMEGFGAGATQDERNGVDGYNATTGGVAVGADTAITDAARLGASFSYAKSWIDGNGTTVSSTNVDSYQVNGYGSYNFGHWYTDGLLGFAYHSYNSSREIDIPAPITARSGDYNGETYTARLGGGYRYLFGNGIDLTPNSSLTYYYNHVNGYNESGAGGLDLSTKSGEEQALIGRIGADAGYSFNYDSMLLRPVLRAAYMYDFLGDQMDTTAQFTGGGATFKSQDASVERNMFDVGASFNIARTDNITFSADYDFLVKENYTENSGMLRARYNF